MDYYKECDAILAYLIANKETNVNKNRIKRDLLQNEDVEVIEHMMKLIINHSNNPQIVKTFNHNLRIGIQANAFTKPFLDKGGFTSLHIASQPTLSFEQQCDRVLKLIVKEDEKTGKQFDALEISQELAIDYRVVNSIATEFEKRGLVELASTNGHWIFITKQDAANFFYRTSFVKEKEERSAGNTHIGDVYNAPVTHGPASPISGGDMKTGNITVNEPDPLAKELNKKQLEDYQETKWYQKNSFRWIIIGIILATIIGLLALWHNKPS